MSEKREKKRRYNMRLEYIAQFEKWLSEEPKMFPTFLKWKKWRDRRPIKHDF